VGIQGVEGSQAVNSSDVALSEFHHLAKLLLVHGRWSYLRLSRTICYFFYKNLALTFTVVWYTLATGFSGNELYNEVAMAGYNVVFTSLPPIVFGLMEQDVGAQASLQHPRLYGAGQSSSLLNTRVFWSWVLEGVWCSLVCFSVPWYATAATVEGLLIGQRVISTLMFTCVFLTVTLRLACCTQFWTWVHHVTYWGSVMLWFLWLFVESSSLEGFSTDGSLYQVFPQLVTMPLFWLCMGLSPAVALLPCLMLGSWKHVNEPTLAAMLRARAAEQTAQEHAEGVKKLAQLEAADEAHHKVWKELKQGFDTTAPDDPSATNVLTGRGTLKGGAKPLAHLPAVGVPPDHVNQQLPGAEHPEKVEA